MQENCSGPGYEAFWHGKCRSHLGHSWFSQLPFYILCLFPVAVPLRLTRPSVAAQVRCGKALAVGVLILPCQAPTIAPGGLTAVAVRRAEIGR